MSDPDVPAAVSGFGPAGGADEGSAGRTTLEPAGRARGGERISALGEVLLCSGFPTQIAVMLGLAAAGFHPLSARGELSLAYVVALSLADTALLLGLIALFMRLRGESPRALFLGARAPLREALLGLLLVPGVFALVALLSAGLQQYAPWLRNVPENPLAALLRDWPAIALFAVVAVIAGGIREEIQRAFVLVRFEHSLGGAWIGLILFSAAFGAGHLLQGWDASLLTAALGLVWGIVYLWRRSIVAPIVCHALFNLVEVVFHGAAQV